MKDVVESVRNSMLKKAKKTKENILEDLIS